MRGRKPDRPGLQEKKGNPRQRKRAEKNTRVSVEVEAGKLSAVAPVSEASPLAKPTSGQKAKPVRTYPKFLDDARLKESLAIWLELEPDLKRLHLLQPLDRNTFAMYCVHMADWIIATRDIQKRGHWKDVKNMNGEPMPRLNPMVKVREIAERHNQVGMLPAQYFLSDGDRPAISRFSLIVATHTEIHHAELVQHERMIWTQILFQDRVGPGCGTGKG